MNPDDLEDDQLEPPDKARVIHRAFCLSAVICRSFIDEHPTVEECISLHTRIGPWLQQTEAQFELEPWEAAVLAQPLGTLDTRTRVNATWMSEGLVVLGWALQCYDLPHHDECVDPKALTNALDFLQPTATEFSEELTMRSSAEIEVAASRAFAVHWRLRQFSLTHQAMDFGEFARTAWFGPLNIDGIELAESDLSLGGVAIAKADANALRNASSIAMERHRAFNWLLGHDAVYSEVDTST